MQPENKKLYFGMKPYLAVADTGRKTPTGVTILQVLYEDGTSVVTTEIFFNLVRSEVPVDMTGFRNLLLPALMRKIFAVFTDYNLSQNDIDAVIQKIVGTWNETFNHAVNFKMGVSVMGDVDMIAINDINNESEAAKKAAAAPTVAAVQPSNGGNGDDQSGGVPVAA